MKKYFQTILFGLAICFLLSSAAVSADPPISETSDVRYRRFHYGYHPMGRIYQRFLPAPRPKELYYSTELKAIANIDDTPEKETAVLMIVSANEASVPGEWVQAYLLITDTVAAGFSKKIDLFKLFDSGTYALEVPAKTVELRSPQFIFTQPAKDALKPPDVSFRLVDLTGDGILDIWVEFGYAVAVISFQNGEFKEIFSAYTVPGLLPDAEYVDLDNDGTYEIKIPYSIYIEELPGLPHLPWMSLYEWDGTAYVLNNERFYAENNEFLIELLSEYNYQLLQRGEFVNYCETYRFYLGLLYYYRGSKSPSDLEWILEHAKQDDYIQAASVLLKKAPPLRR